MRILINSCRRSHFDWNKCIMCFRLCEQSSALVWLWFFTLLVVSEVHQQSNYGYPSQSLSMEETYSPDCVVASDTLLHQFTKVEVRIMYKKLEIQVIWGVTLCCWVSVPTACPTTQRHIPDDLICSSTALRTSYLAYTETWNGLIHVNCYINIELALVSFLLCSSFSKMNLEWICGKNVAMWSKRGRNHSSAQVVGRIICIREVCGVIRIENVDRNLVFSVLIVHFDRNTSSTLIHTLNISTAYPCEVWNNCFCSYFITFTRYLWRIYEFTY